MLKAGPTKQGKITTIVGLCVLAILASSSRTGAERYPMAENFPRRDRERVWYHGQPPVVNVPSLSLPMHYGNGMNTYEFVGSNPIVRIDPTGNSWMTPYSIAGGPFLMAPEAIGYFAGQLIAGHSGFGPGTLAGKVAMWSEKFGPTWTSLTTAGVAQWLILDVLPEVGEKMLPPNLRRTIDRSVSTLVRGNGGTLGIGAGISAFAGMYVGYLDSVIWTVDTEMSHGRREWNPVSEYFLDLLGGD
jgi:hypothetical protein